MITSSVLTFNPNQTSFLIGRKVLLFDFDGVLVDSESFYDGLWKNILTPYNVSFEAMDLTGKTNKQFLSQFDFDSAEMEDLLKLKIRAEHEFFENKLMDPNLFNLLENLNQRFKIGIVSNNKLTNIQAYLSVNKCSHFFQNIISEESGLAVKPAPDLYLKALAYFGVEKNQALIIEDSPIGFASAENAEIDYFVFDQQSLKQSIQSLEIAMDLRITN
jgi:HAD superfamily hydrolase (TIGR01509 family)